MAGVEVRAVVTLTIEVQPGDLWSLGTTVEQVRAQAIEGARIMLNRTLAGEPKIRVVGDPAVKVVSFDTGG